MHTYQGLEYITTKLALFLPTDLHKIDVNTEIDNNDYHIYLIGQRKQFFFESFYKTNLLGITTVYYLDEKQNKVRLKFFHFLSYFEFVEDLKNGYYQILNKKQKNIIRDFTLINYLEGGHRFPKERKTSKELKRFSDIEILYIGQAFGRKNTKKIDYRLKRHEKLIEIQAENSSKRTNQEILILGIQIRVKDIAMIYSSLDNNSILSNKEINNIVNNSKKRASKKQEISLFEAALINYFKPKFNEDFVNNFLVKTAKSYNEIFNLPINIFSINIDTESIGSRLYSEHIKEPKFIHFKKYFTDKDETNIIHSFFNNIQE
ncbi:hypothetical protein HX071_16545 [Myroides marinus]|uniref:hypothetical protein n=1 Tax=Myroides marinus TaxID=703342 RepID=UPI002577E101|nr:hypothetical protein [Myroides marinus]MDM1503788.1 hypothetical protein [Myroides marinus]